MNVADDLSITTPDVAPSEESATLEHPAHSSPAESEPATALGAVAVGEGAPSADAADDGASSAAAAADHPTADAPSPVPSAPSEASVYAQPMHGGQLHHAAPSAGGAGPDMAPPEYPAGGPAAWPNISYDPSHVPPASGATTVLLEPPAEAAAAHAAYATPHAALATLRSRAQALVVRLATAPDDEVPLVQSHLDNTIGRIEAVERARRALSSTPVEAPRRPTPVTPATVTAASAAEPAAFFGRMPPKVDLPTYNREPKANATNVTDDIDDFLDDAELAFEATGASDQQRVALLRRHLPQDLVDLLREKRPASWSATRSLLRTYEVPPGEDVARRRALRDFARESDEPVRALSLRFTKVARRAGANASDRSLLEQYFSVLPRAVRARAEEHDFTNPFPDVAAATVFALRAELWAKGTRAREDGARQDKAKERPKGRNGQSNNSSDKQRGRDGRPYCSYHKSHGHADKDCRAKQQQPGSSGGRNKPGSGGVDKGAPSGTPSNRACFHCGAEGHYANACPRKSRGAQANNVEVTSADAPGQPGSAADYHRQVAHTLDELAQAHRAEHASLVGDAHADQPRVNHVALRPLPASAGMAPTSSADTASTSPTGTASTPSTDTASTPTGEAPTAPAPMASRSTAAESDKRVTFPRAPTVQQLAVIAVLVNDTLVDSVLVDSGANVTIISLATAQRLGLNIDRSVRQTLALGAESSSHDAYGVVRDTRLQYGASGCSVDVMVAETPTDYQILLGLNVMAYLGLHLSGFLPRHLIVPGQARGDNDITKPYDCGADFEPPKKTTAPAEQLPEYALDLLRLNFGLDPTEPVSAPGATVHVDTGDAAPAFTPPYRIAEQWRDQISAQIQQWLDEGVIKRVPFSRWNVPLVAVRKSDGSLRLCGDFRRLNKLLVNDDRFPLPDIHDVLRRLTVDGNCIFSSLDAVGAFNQLAVAAEDQLKLAFVYDNLTFCWVRCPFGLKFVTSHLQRLLAGLLAHIPGCVVYADDITLASATATDHFRSLAEILRVLNRYHVRLSERKCVFAVPELRVLGHVVDADGYRPCSTSVQHILSLPMPTDGAAVASWMAMVGFFRASVPSLAHLGRPLDRFRAVRGPITLDDEARQAFADVRHALANAIPLAAPAATDVLVLATDASRRGMGFALFALPAGAAPTDVDGARAVLFGGRVLQDRETRHDIFRLELTALVFAVTKCSHLLLGRHFHVLCDNAAVAVLLRDARVAPVVHRALLTLLEYDFDITFVPTEANVLPDALSRVYPRDLVPPPPSAVNTVLAVATAAESPGTLAVPPVDRRPQLLLAAHGVAHLGAAAMARAVREQSLSWSSLREDCADFVRSCLSCSLMRVTRDGFRPAVSIDAAEPWAELAIDLAGPFPDLEEEKRPAGAPDTYLLVITDLCTRFTLLRALPDKTAASVATALASVFGDFGFPRAIMSDNGSEFVNATVAKLLQSGGVAHRTTAAYNPRANGVAERHVGTALEAIRKAFAAQPADGPARSWADNLPLIQLAVNRVHRRRLKATPYDVFFARIYNEPVDYTEAPPLPLASLDDLAQRQAIVRSAVLPGTRQHIDRDQAARVIRLDRRAAAPPIAVGDLVLVRKRVAGAARDNKLASHFLPLPFTVTRVLPSGALRVKDAYGALLPRTVAVSAVRKFTGARPAVETDPAKVSYEVERIVDHKKEGGRMLYLVEWAHWPASQSTWEPASSFDSPTTIKQYHAARRAAARAAPAPAARAVPAPSAAASSPPQGAMPARK